MTALDADIAAFCRRIRLVLERIPRRTDFQPRPEDALPQQILHGQIAAGVKISQRWRLVSGGRPRGRNAERRIGHRRLKSGRGFGINRHGYSSFLSHPTSPFPPPPFL